MSSVEETVLEERRKLGQLALEPRSHMLPMQPGPTGVQLGEHFVSTHETIQLQPSSKPLPIASRSVRFQWAINLVNYVISAE
jgi:hypothetical protein